MLHIIYGDTDRKDYIFDPDTFFNNTYEDEWMEEQRTAEMIEDIDKSYVVGPHLIESPFLGPISAERLSGGVKTLILINHDDAHVFNASACGNNCAKWLLRIADEKDITIRLGYFMDFGEEMFKICVVNTGKIVTSRRELNDEILQHGLL